MIEVIPEAAAERTLVIIKPWQQEKSEVVRTRLNERLTTSSLAGVSNRLLNPLRRRAKCRHGAMSD